MRDTGIVVGKPTYRLWYPFPCDSADQETHTHTHTQPFYGSLDFVRDNPSEPVPEETFTHSPIVVISRP